MKLVAVATVMLLSFYSVCAQTISLGPTAGFGHSTVSVKDSPLDKEFFPAYNFGAKLVYSIVYHWGISVDVKFSGEGGKLTGNMGGLEYEHKYRAHYIRIPFQGVYFFGKLGNPVRPKIALGPAIGFLVGGDATERVNNEQTSTLKVKDVLEGFDFGINGAFGANFRLKGDKWLNADITYYHGLTNISASVENIKNRNIGLNIGILFPIGNK